MRPVQFLFPLLQKLHIKFGVDWLSSFRNFTFYSLKMVKRRTTDEGRLTDDGKALTSPNKHHISGKLKSEITEVLKSH